MLLLTIKGRKASAAVVLTIADSHLMKEIEGFCDRFPHTQPNKLSRQEAIEEDTMHARLHARSHACTHAVPYPHSSTQESDTLKSCSPEISIPALLLWVLYLVLCIFLSIPHSSLTQSNILSNSTTSMKLSLPSAIKDIRAHLTNRTPQTHSAAPPPHPHCPVTRALDSRQAFLLLLLC